MPEANPKAIFIRNFVFGVEDSLVSTVGLLSGIAAASVPKPTIILTGIVLIFVEAVSMGAGSFLAEDTTENYLEEKEADIKYPLKGGLVMFLSYFIAGFIPLLPYAIFTINSAFIISIIVSLIALFLLGLISAKISHTNLKRSITRMAVVGGLAILVGVVVGKIFNNV